jgi:hypothetical protein
LLELAETIVELTSSKSGIVHEALPIDDPKVRRPDISLAQQVLGWQPKVGLREGLQLTLERAGTTIRSMSTNRIPRRRCRQASPRRTPTTRGWSSNTALR